MSADRKMVEFTIGKSDLPEWADEPWWVDVSVPGVGTVPITEAEATMSAAVAKVERWCEQRGATLILGTELTAIVERATGEAAT
jgi:hypothetical protein